MMIGRRACYVSSRSYLMKGAKLSNATPFNAWMRNSIYNYDTNLMQCFIDTNLIKILY